MNPDYPIYIVSKGRWESRLTSKALESLLIPYRIVIEPQEYEQYSSVINPKKILILPFSNLGQGSIPARNYIWEHSISEGYSHHWILDDNIRGFRRRIEMNKRPRVTDGAIFKATEDFINRYENIALSGFNYHFFGNNSLTNPKNKVVLLNDRIYSCILIRNDIPYRWRGRYNEDTDLSLRVLKDGWCTVLFNTFLCEKAATLSMKGGNTEELYKLNNGQDGRLLMAQSLQKQHPDVVRVVRKWGRWQHQVDYRPFRKNKLILKKDVIIPEGNNEYGMILRKKNELEVS